MIIIYGYEMYVEFKTNIRIHENFNIAKAPHRFNTAVVFQYRCNMRQLHFDTAAVKYRFRISCHKGSGGQIMFTHSERSH